MQIHHTIALCQRHLKRLIQKAYAGSQLREVPCVLQEHKPTVDPILCVSPSLSTQRTLHFSATYFVEHADVLHVEEEECTLSRLCVSPVCQTTTKNSPSPSHNSPSSSVRRITAIFSTRTSTTSIGFPTNVVATFRSRLSRKRVMCIRPQTFG